MWGRKKQQSNLAPALVKGRRGGAIIDAYGEIAAAAKNLTDSIVDTPTEKKLRQRTDMKTREIWTWSFLESFQKKLGSFALQNIIESFNDYAIAGKGREWRKESIEALQALSGFTQIPPMNSPNIPVPDRYGYEDEDEEE